MIHFHNIDDWFWFVGPLCALGLSLQLFIAAAIDRGNQTPSKLEIPVILSVVVFLAWNLANAVWYLLEIIPYSEPVISSPYISIPAIAIGLLLYRLRGARPLLYGIMEISVSILVIFVSIGTPSTHPLNKIVAIIGGVYILIRGMDNIEKGLPARWRSPWERVFPKESAPTLTQPKNPSDTQ
jgi:hypothetical protein